MKLAPSKNPEEESKKLSIIVIILGIGSLLIWPLGVAGLALGVRGIILSKRVSNTKQLTLSATGVALSLLALFYHYNQ